MRATKGAARNKAKKRLFKKVEGYVGGRRKLYRTAKETLIRAGVFAFRDRRAKKRDFRRLFIIRLTAAAEMRGLRYSQLMHGLRLANVGLDRKSLSQLAIFDTETFDAIVALGRVELDKHEATIKARNQANQKKSA
ncbi:50S ribosomal protein L20 [Isosphaeraceae bacterium EP7]